MTRLQGYRLDFNMQVPMWNGAVATIVPDPKGIVWGALWKIDIDQMKNLDKQEGVDRGWYYPKNVTVITKNGSNIQARTYIEVHNPEKLQPGNVLPYNRLPSDTYLGVILYGADESRLPHKYISYLNTFPTNHKKAPRKTLEDLRTLLRFSNN